ncbi:MAG: hypothetical protein ABR911_03420 [Syntrophales bacterium]
MDAKKESIVVTVNLKQDIVNSIDELASAYGVKSNKLIGNLIGIGLDEIKALKKYGLLKKGLLAVSLLEQYGLLEKKDEEGTDKPNRAMSISIRVGKELSGELDQWAIDLGMTKNSMIVWCIKNALLDFQALKDFHVFNLSLGLVRLEDWVKKVFSEARLKKLWRERFKKAGSISKKMFNINL